MPTSLSIAVSISSLPDGQAEMAVHTPFPGLRQSLLSALPASKGRCAPSGSRSPPATLLRPLAEYGAVAGGSW